MKFGLLGYPLSHSMSKFIHSELFAFSGEKASYEMIECKALDKKCLSRLKELDGFNVTIPYKNKIITYLNKLDVKANCYQSVNTVSTKEGMKGYNTDVDGFLDSVVKINADLSGNVLVLGAGGVARMVVYETASRGGRVTIASRKESFDKANLLKEDISKSIKGSQIAVIDINNIEGKFDLVINCTPVGMFPDTNKSPIEKRDIENCKAVVDLIYNPYETKLMKIAKDMNKPNIGGMYMLVKQAARAQEIWTGKAFGEYALEEIEKKANIYLRRNFQSCNIYFVGFMASGKTTAAKELSQNMGLDFVDVDKEIEKRQGLSVSQIFEKKGEEFFRKLERQLIKEFSQKKDMIISLGGGAVMDAKNQNVLKDAGIIVYIDTPFEICLSRIKQEGNRPVAEREGAEKLKQLYSKREAVYQEIADIKVNGEKELDEKVKEICGFISL